MDNKIKGIVIVVLIALICTACSANAQLNEHIIVKAVGIDKGTTSAFEVSLQYFNASGSGSTSSVDNSKSNVLTAYGSGNTVNEALLNASAINGKILLLEQNDIIIVGKELLSEDIGAIFDFYKGQNLHTLVATSEKAKDVIDVKFKEGSASTEKLKYIFKNASRYGLCQKNTLLDINIGLATPGGNIFLPRLVAEENKTDTSEGYENVKLEGGVLVKGSGGYLEISDNDMKALCLLQGKTDTLVVPINVNGVKADFTLSKVGVDIAAKMADTGLQFIVTVTAEGNILQDRLSLPYESLEKLAVSQLTAYLSGYIEHSIKDNTLDSINLSSIIRHNDYALWKRLQGDFSTLLKESGWEIRTILDSHNAYYYKM